ncbi:MAG: DegT/DnrJ/EryC1/StrS family aminotransferase [Phycisphaerales bacterium]|nr:DegT/DnrJ/EryC1/StrS family aminotransferase [Phycisphaerae bacterium]NNF44762.1 DegT/DnrJ/EryC1/StrS family aminotransferase [Phycisphaerales bacterium]NNM27815.1 DegT/DnrJ/EryC1/StrS family aminotransferase [Phycisphaerales bacterium]
MTDTIPLSLPDITDAEVRAVVATLRSGRLSIGPQAEEFERLVARRAGRTHGIAVSSGTAGLHLALLALGIGPEDEVITPAFSFVASANCVLYVGAKPVFVDCDPRTLNMRADAVESKITDRTKAIIGVEVFGNPAGMSELAALSNKYEIPLIEDACEGLGGRLGTDAIGGFGRVAVFGFYPNKQITTGEGGMIVTHDDTLADQCRSLRNHGRAGTSRATASGGPAALGSWLEHERMGFNFRMNELSAALGVAQMRRLDELLEMRQWVAETYTRRLMGNADVLVPTVAADCFMSWFVYVVRLSDRFTEAERDEIIAGLRRHDVGASNYFPPIPMLPHFRRLCGHQPGDFPVAESVSHRTIALPFFTRLTGREVDLVCQTLELMIKRASFARSAIEELE